MSKTYYIAGPMTGYDSHNFCAFYEAEAALQAKGYGTLNPARMDEECGYDPSTEPTQEFLEDAMKRDINAIHKADGIVLLPGWERSVGATAEMWLARWRHIEILLYPSLVPLEQEDILDEAKRITSGDRQAQYGPPDQDFRRTADMWTALFGNKLKEGSSFRPQDVAMAMICLKLSRQVHQNKRDNATDIAGYARCLWICQQAEK